MANLRRFVFHTFGFETNETRDAQGSRAFTLIELLCTMLIITIVIALAVVGAVGAKRRAVSVSCQGNLRQFGFAVRIYADENRGRAPQVNAWDLKGVEALKLSLDIPSNIYRCRADRNGRFVAIGSSYDWNLQSSGRLLHRLRGDQPSRPENPYFLFYDSQFWHGFKNAVCADGHIDRLKRDSL